MPDRPEIDRLLRQFYAARVRGHLDGVCRTFSHDAKFRIAGTSHGNSIAVTAVGANEIRRWLALMIKSFQLTEHSIQLLIIDGPRAAVHWRTSIYSRITGTNVPTELVDLVSLRGGRIVSYIEFFVSC